MKYGTMGLSNVEGERGATTYGKTSITDGDISCNMDIYWDGITQFDPENNSYRNLRFLNKSGVYRQPGELFLDITYDLGSVKNLGELWIATNTENNYYKTGVYEVYISNSLNDLYYTDNFYTSFDSRNEKYSGITKTIFSCGKEGRYIGIRITQGIINKPTTNPWSTSNITAAYARMRGIALFEYNLNEDQIYRMVNSTSGLALEVEEAGTETGTRLCQYTLNYGSDNQKFFFDYQGNNEYKIIPKYTEGMVIGINGESQVVLVEDSNANNSKWYVLYCGGNEYIIVNKAHPGKYLSVGNQTENETYLSLSENEIGSKWKLRKYEITIHNYYDYCFKGRYRDYWDAAEKTTEITNEVKRIMEHAFAAEITIDDPQLYATVADYCKLNDASIQDLWGSEITDLDSLAMADISVYNGRCWGSEAEIGNHICQIHSCENHKNNEHNCFADNLFCDDEGIGECTSWSESYYHFRNEINDWSADNIYVLYNGSALYDLDSDARHLANRSFQNDNKICMQWLYAGEEYYELALPVATHEMSHVMGGEDHYHEMLDDETCRGGLFCSGFYEQGDWQPCSISKDDPEYDPRPMSCLMNDSNMANISKKTVDEIWCSACKMEIENYIY